MTQAPFVSARTRAIAALAICAAMLAVPAQAQDRCNDICDAKNKPCIKAINDATPEWRKQHGQAAIQKCLMHKLECYKQCMGLK
jgi:hypothetical protein